MQFIYLKYNDFLYKYLTDNLYLIYLCDNSYVMHAVHFILRREIKAMKELSFAGLSQGETDMNAAHRRNMAEMARRIAFRQLFDPTAELVRPV